MPGNSPSQMVILTTEQRLDQVISAMESSNNELRARAAINIGMRELDDWGPDGPPRTAFWFEMFRATQMIGDNDVAIGCRSKAQACPDYGKVSENGCLFDTPIAYRSPQTRAAVIRRLLKKDLKRLK